MTTCGICGTQFAKKRSTQKWCSKHCYVKAKIDAKRHRYQIDPEARYKQIIRARAAYQVKDKQPCRVCGSDKVERHHIRYDNNPGSVEWYCHRHHAALHAELRRNQ
jgi:hypothetical protein